MISAIQDLAEGALSKGIHDLVTVSQVVMVNHQIIATVIIIRVIVRAVLLCRLFLLTACTSIIHSRVIKDLFTFKGREVLCLVALQNG